MPSRRPRRLSRSVGSASLAFALLAAACSSSDDTADAGDPAAEDGTEEAAQPDPEPTPEPEPLRLLVTNDDGIGADGIDVLVEALVAMDDVDVTVVAPAENQSGSGAQESAEPPGAIDATTASGYAATAVEGFPADAVVHAVDGLGLMPHLVVSGINSGQNIGDLVPISGTVGAARRAVDAGYPALALSADLNAPDYEPAASFAVEWIEERRTELLAGSHPVVVTSANIPTCPGGPRGEVEVEIGLFDGRNPFAEAVCDSDVTDPVDDVDGYINGYITVTEVDLPGGGGELTVETSLGLVEGVDEDGVHAWRAIPYAAPPLGENRWRDPQPHPGWSTPLAATEPGAACIQPTDDPVTQLLVIPEQDEDCLTLSVYAPTGASDLPVMVWIHGGGFVTGSAHQPLYDGVDLAAEGVVVVAVNYRLGPLGFLALNELGEEGGGRIGNYGIADQIAALGWVADNAAAFGGDPGNVTVFGESAGGFSVCALLGAPSAAGLFHKAIIQSGGGCESFGDLDEALAAGAEVAEATGCADGLAGDEVLECLRAVPTGDLLLASSEGSVVGDGVLLTEPAISRAQAGELGDLPIMMGSNLDEYTLFTFSSPEPADGDLDALVEPFTDDPSALLALYPPADYDSNLARLQTLLADQVFACPARRLARAMAANGPVYAYEYRYVSDADPFGLGATHGAELVFVFANPEGIVGLEPELDEVSAALSDEIQTAWTTFAASGAPAPSVAWPAETPDEPAVMLLDRELSVVDEIRDGRCDQIAALDDGAPTE